MTGAEPLIPVAEADGDDEHVVVEPGLWDRVRAKVRCLRRGRHRWADDGPTVGGIWLRCVDCRQIDEFLPGVHEPAGGNDLWHARWQENRPRDARGRWVLDTTDADARPGHRPG